MPAHHHQIYDGVHLVVASLKHLNLVAKQFTRDIRTKGFTGQDLATPCGASNCFRSLGCLGRLAQTVREARTRPVRPDRYTEAETLLHGD